MARNTRIQVLRTTRANLDAQAAASGLYAGEPYLITDEGRLAIGTGATSYVEAAASTDELKEFPFFQADGSPSNIPLGVSGLAPVTGEGVTNIVALTQAEYDALTPVATTLYIITDA